MLEEISTSRQLPAILFVHLLLSVPTLLRVYLLGAIDPRQSTAAVFPRHAAAYVRRVFGSAAFEGKIYVDLCGIYRSYLFILTLEGDCVHNITLKLDFESSRKITVGADEKKKSQHITSRIKNCLSL